MRSYVICKNCGFKIQLPFTCRFEYPLHFAVTCTRCKIVNIYHRLEVKHENEEYCSKILEESEKRTKYLDYYVIQQLLYNVITPPLETLLSLIEKIKHTQHKNKEVSS